MHSSPYKFFQTHRVPNSDHIEILSLQGCRSRHFLKIMSTLCERVWQRCDIAYYRIRISIDITVETIFGNQRGGRKGHNTKYRGKKALRPILCFIDETREYLIGKLRKGQTVSGKEAADFIKKINNHLSGCVQQGIANNTIRIARLKLLFIAAKVVKESNVDKVKYSIHDAKTPAMMNLL